MNIYTPYTYLVGWSHLGKYYYGVRYAKGCHPDDFWVKYFTSSKKVLSLLETEGKPDIIQIRKTFNDPIDAISWEEKVLRRLKVLQKQDIWLNRNIAGSFDPKICGQHTKGTKRSKEAILKAIETKKKNNKPNKNKGQKRPNISKALKGKPSNNKGKKFGPASREHVEKMLESRKAFYAKGNHGPNKNKKMSDEQKQKIGNTSKGHKKPEDFSQKLRELKTGTKSLYKTGFKTKKAKPGSERWNALISEGYQPKS